MLYWDVGRYGDRWYMLRNGGNLATLVGMTSAAGGNGCAEQSGAMEAMREMEGGGTVE